MKRWPELKPRKPEHIAKARAKAASRQTIEQFREGLLKCLRRNGLEHRVNLACRLWNCDESRFATSVTATKVLVKKVLELYMMCKEARAKK